MQFDQLRRREFITLLGGAAAAWPLAARAQQAERMRRIGVLMSLAADDPEMTGAPRSVPAGAAAFGLDRRPQPADRHPLGRWRCRAHSQIRGGISRARPRRHPGLGRPSRGWRCSRRPAPCRSCSRSVPDPVGAGFVASLARPGGNATGFTQFEYGVSAKWLELLKEIAPARDARGGPSRSHHTRRDRPVRHNPGRGAVARGGVAPDRCARRGRDRARRHGIRARGEWRPDRTGERVGERSSRTDHHAGGPAPIARGLPVPLLTSLAAA